MGQTPVKTSLSTLSADPEEARRNSARGAFTALALFMVVYCVRPQDWMPFLAVFPLAKIFGLLAIVGFLWSRMTGRLESAPFPREMIYMILLLIQLVICIPFAVWRGGSFQLVIMNFSEVVILTITLALTVTTMDRLWRLVFIQSLGVVVVAAVSLFNDQVLHSSAEGISRITGAVGGIFENPNDLAVSVAMVFPLCFMFLLRSRAFFPKAFWAVSSILLARAVLMTYSRSGFLALSVAVLVTLYEFGIKGKRPSLFLFVGVGLALLLVLSGPTNYASRLSTIFSPNSDLTGSAQARRELLIKSLKITAEHPLVGIGPGDFPIVSGVWLVTHNTYTELSAEAGIPALVLFLIIFGRTFKNLRKTRQAAPDNEQIRMLAGGLTASTAALLVGSFFASTAYHFFPYFLVAYASALCAIAGRQQAPHPEPAQIRLQPGRTAERPELRPAVRSRVH